jgi:hypothetical protein
MSMADQWAAIFIEIINETLMSTNMQPYTTFFAVLTLAAETLVILTRRGRH